MFHRFILVKTDPYKAQANYQEKVFFFSFFQNKIINNRELTLDLGEPPQFSSTHLKDGPGEELWADKDNFR